MRIFILEDDPLRMQHLRVYLGGVHDITHIDSCRDADKFQPPYDVVLLDHDLGGSQMGMKHGRPLSIAEAEDCGLTFVKLVKDRMSADQLVVIHSFNPGGAERMAQELSGTCRCYIAPFGSAGFKRLIYMAQERARQAA